VAKLENSRDRFDEAAGRVHAAASGSSDLDQNELLRYIDGLRTNATGTIEFWWVSLICSF
jgi:hypothetical protein